MADCKVIKGLILRFVRLPRSARTCQTTEFHIYGGGNVKSELQALVQEFGLNAKVFFFDSISMRRIAEIVANADLGIVAKRADSFGNEAYSTKIMEYMAVGVPVIVSRTKIDRFYFNDSVVQFFESGNENELAKAMLEVLQNPALREKMIVHASEYVARNCWEVRKGDYLNLVDSLISGNVYGTGTALRVANHANEVVTVR